MPKGVNPMDHKKTGLEIDLNDSANALDGLKKLGAV